ncbi:MAG: hypothetical protein ACLSB9_11245 [Hydrogeniiclostridium mannosilyticum]
MEGYGDSDLHVAGDAMARPRCGCSSGRSWSAGRRRRSDGRGTGPDGQQRGDHVRPVRERAVDDERLTDNATPDVAPVVAVNDDSVFVAWRSVYVEDQSNVTDFGQSDKIMFQRYDRKTKT